MERRKAHGHQGLAYLVQAATAAEPLREQFPGQLIFCVGTESTLFTLGIVPGKTANQRLHDLDMTATSLVKTYARRRGTYPDLPWEPKQAFSAVASFYATR